MPERKIKGGLYLVVDPSLGLEFTLPKVECAIKGGIHVLQVWNNWSPEQDKRAFIDAVCREAHAKNIPVLINEEWSLLQSTSLDGVHFDLIPQNLPLIRSTVNRPFLLGITCGNHLETIAWANKNGCDYISFCSMFPSSSAGVCEIVSKETVSKARAMTYLPIFLAGGITLDNLHELSDTGMNGVALISAIFKAADPELAARAFNQKLEILFT